ncbi:hypothetical protein [Burkholderia anthina]|uniref:hypothetical protein n=1 Tax=Burkholderia anthina TaxID=179879 RepID=UPI0015898EBE|nr:hypothetical protein [Burkholderia anthina]
MAAIREVLADGVLKAIGELPALADIRLERSLVRAIALRDIDVALAVTLGNDVADEVMGRTTWQTELLVHAIVRDDEPDRVSDDYLAMVHPVVKNFQHDRLMGIVITRIDEPVYGNVGGAACVRTAYYRIEYQTTSDSLE